MSIKDILVDEEMNTESIRLYSEGIFLKAYEVSAYLFTQHIKAYSIKQKHYKNVGADVVSLGFPTDK